MPNAVFTSLDARPGDSGAPLVDPQGRVTAIVHGGARCEIAVPTAKLASVRVSAPTTAPAKPVDRPDERDADNSWVFERTKHGFSFRWSFHWRSD